MVDLFQIEKETSQYNTKAKSETRIQVKTAITRLDSLCFFFIPIFQKQVA